jgi:hypothetical protein
MAILVSDEVVTHELEPTARSREPMSRSAATRMGSPMKKRA